MECCTGPRPDAKLKDMLHMPPDGLQPKTGHVAHQVDQQWKRRNCTRGAFNVITTCGSMKLRKRKTNFRHKVSDSGGRFWEELSIRLDCSTNFSKYSGDQSADFSVTDLAEELKVEDLKALPVPTAWIPPSTGRHDDIDMEPDNDLQATNESFHTETMMINLPQRYSRTSELPKGLGGAVGLIPDNSSLMDVEFSESTGLASNPMMAPLPQPLLVGYDGDIVMHDETMIKKSKEMPILERVGETLRQKKLRATQA